MFQNTSNVYFCSSVQISSGAGSNLFVEIGTGSSQTSFGIVSEMFQISSTTVTNLSKPIRKLFYFRIIKPRSRTFRTYSRSIQIYSSPIEICSGAFQTYLSKLDLFNLVLKLFVSIPELFKFLQQQLLIYWNLLLSYSISELWTLVPELFKLCTFSI